MSPRQRDRVRSLVAEAENPIDAHTVAAVLNIHVTTARFHLNNLVDEGAVAAVALPPDGVGRPKVGYRTVATPPIDDLLILLIARTGETPEARETLAADVGRAWAAGHPPAVDVDMPDPVVVAETVLTRLGFTVTGVVSAFGSHEITLCGCPLHDLERTLPEVARGLVRGILEGSLFGSAILRSAYAVDVRPDPHAGACELRLSLAPAPADSPAL
ncbi:MAG: hypothetical protein QM809_06410 [Gordonia sp. (in: high G+C Gram-positive bacteria)]|uniref:hypothetical protein n=1 Tax=Gordonia sp. (in: high G+C Gram-positive bacteria) TaxID=84139 RepID=UPI0039E69128